MIARGAALMMVGQASFLLSAFAINFGLARLFGPGDYGTFGVVMSVLIVAELFVITGIPELVQKFGGENPDRMYLLKKITLPWQIGYSVVVMVIFWFCANWVAKSFNDVNLTFFLRLAGINVVFYGVFKYYQGLQNGLHKFDKHAILGIAYSISKVSAIFGLVLTGFSLSGALVGNTLGSVGGLIAGLVVTKIPKTTGELDRIPYVRFTIPNIFYFVGLYLFFCIDLWFVKYYAADMEVGYYVSAGALAKIPYVFSIALSAALLPSVARATKINDEKQVREVTGQSIRYVLMFLLLFCVVLNTTAVEITKLLFGAAYENAAAPLAILIFGLSFITIFAVLHTILQSRNKMTTSFIVMLFMVIVDLIANFILVPGHGMMGAAYATTISAAIGVAITGVLVNIDIKSFFPGLSTLKMLAIASLVFFISFISPALNSVVILKAVGLAVLYFILLWLVGEIKSADVSRLKSVMGF